MNPSLEMIQRSLDISENNINLEAINIVANLNIDNRTNKWCLLGWDSSIPNN